jgi:hypothetical protein
MFNVERVHFLDNKCSAVTRDVYCPNKKVRRRAVCCVRAAKARENNNNDTGQRQGIMNNENCDGNEEM